MWISCYSKCSINVFILSSTLPYLGNRFAVS
jgi:hypothetical protein